MRRRAWVLIAGAVVVAAIVGSTAFAVDDTPASDTIGVGDCVVIPPLKTDAMHATKQPCSADVSFTVGALADSGTCPGRYHHFPTPFADPETATLCLVPNLVVDHCYSYGIPSDMVDLVDCEDPTANFRVTAAFDADDATLCPDVKDHYAWTYSAPARTYCTVSIV